MATKYASDGIHAHPNKPHKEEADVKDDRGPIYERCSVYTHIRREEQRGRQVGQTRDRSFARSRATLPSKDPALSSGLIGEVDERDLEVEDPSSL